MPVVQSSTVPIADTSAACIKLPAAIGLLSELLATFDFRREAPPIFGLRSPVLAALSRRL
jgi:hypothetical protein